MYAQEQKTTQGTSIKPQSINLYDVALRLLLTVICFMDFYLLLFGGIALTTNADAFIANYKQSGFEVDSIAYVLFLILEFVYIASFIIGLCLSYYYLYKSQSSNHKLLIGAIVLFVIAGISKIISTYTLCTYIIYSNNIIFTILYILLSLALFLLAVSVWFESRDYILKILGPMLTFTSLIFAVITFFQGSK